VSISPNSTNLLIKRKGAVTAAFLLVLLLAALPFSVVGTANGQSPLVGRRWVVDDDLPADFHTIQEAIDAASGGDTIFVRSGTYTENVTVNKSVSLIGENATRTIIASQTDGKVVMVTAFAVTIEGFTVQGPGSTQRQPFNIGVYFVSSAAFCNVSHNVFTGHG
jgi:nitrous oxidase accessory protein NosD